ncbi:adenylate kinase family enzyme [Planomicrobium stackebrandtii]|uniref:Adenylate kinase family enzyme n=1 Tax=Planomicrobium stackebrandtii TaxID=253160 RepID=A0ABU0GSV0_9BACL|nr:AAA family ATPase [Planomicrobium stackebrandtii]MDQ0427642.1 adenylate kinase family enzyme [Planomicrobium stackebrandtii]
MKIQVIGGSGTGKSTLAKYISEQENCVWIDTDRYLWKDSSFTENHPAEKRLELYKKDMQSTDRYAVSGSVFSWCKDGFNNRELFIFLELDEAERMKRLLEREANRGNLNNMWPDQQGKPTNDFIEWCKTYHTSTDKTAVGTYEAHMHELELSQSPILKLNSSKSTEELYREIAAAYKKLNR